MNTRSFLKSLLVAAVAPSVFAPVLADRFVWKKCGLWIPKGQFIGQFYMAIHPAFPRTGIIIFSERELEPFDNWVNRQGDTCPKMELLV